MLIAQGVSPGTSRQYFYPASEGRQIPCRLRLPLSPLRGLLSEMLAHPVLTHWATNISPLRSFETCVTDGQGYNCINFHFAHPLFAFTFCLL